MAKYYGKKHAATPRAGAPASWRPNWLLFALFGALALIIAGAVVLGRGAASGQASPAPAGGEATVPQASGPRLAVDRETIDFGPVKMDTPVTAAFKVRNTGNEPLQVLGEPRVRVLEGC
jgi:hypothetical protein